MSLRIVCADISRPPPASIYRENRAACADGTEELMPVRIERHMNICACRGEIDVARARTRDRRLGKEREWPFAGR